MRLFHVSECPTIELFEPRLPPGGASGPVVWAIAESHLVNYLVPRECPRVTFHASPTTDPADCDHFLRGASHVVAIEEAWLERATRTELWLYELSTSSFVCRDMTAGYFTSTTAIAPVTRSLLKRPLMELAIRGAELRVLPNLQSLASAVAASSLAFSCIRMRNALP